MKKNLMAAVLAASFMFGTGSMYGAEEPKTGLKAKAMKRFDTSVDRLKRCFTGKCTKWEALKATRDVTIAAGAVIAAVYVVSKGGGAGLRATRTPIGWHAARVVEKPAEFIERPFKAYQKKRVLQKLTDRFPMDSTVQERGTRATVIGYSYGGGNPRLRVAPEDYRSPSATYFFDPEQTTLIETP